MTSPNLGPTDTIGRLQGLSAPYMIADTHWDDVDESTLHANWVVNRTFQTYVSKDGWAHLRGTATSHDLVSGIYEQSPSEIVSGDGVEYLIVLPEECRPRTSVYVTIHGSDAFWLYTVEINAAGEVIIPQMGGIWINIPGVGLVYGSGNVLKFDHVKWRSYQGDEDEDFVE